MVERPSALLRSPGGWQGVDGIARAVGERVLAACGAARGCFGRVRGAARLHVSAPCRKAAPSMHSASAVLALCAADAHEVISAT